jgi:uncharacterized protein (TIGR02996 family)
LTDRAALLANVLSTPADDTARLVLADYLEENGEDALGRFLRAGVVAARFRDEEFIDDPDYYAAIAEIAAVAKTGRPARWVAALGIGPHLLAPGDWAWDNTGDRVSVRVGQAIGTFTRGLLAKLEVTLGEWYAVASPALAAWPLERVRVSDVPGLSFDMARLVVGWRLTGRMRLPRRNVPLTGNAIPASISPGAVLTHAPADWAADQLFADRATLVAGIAKESVAIVADLMDAAGDRWPSPPRRRT